MPRSVNASAAHVIAQLGLEPLPHEGGYFRRTWTGPVDAARGRATGTSIYFLATGADFSALHRLKTDEVWHFHAGDPMEQVQLDPATGGARVVRLGANLLAGEVPQAVVPGGVWQGGRARPGAQHGWSLVGCTMAPGWIDGEFELGERAALRRDFPHAADWIDALTR